MKNVLGEKDFLKILPNVSYVSDFTKFFSNYSFRIAFFLREKVIRKQIMEFFYRPVNFFFMNQTLFFSQNFEWKHIYKTIWYLFNDYWKSYQNWIVSFGVCFFLLRIDTFYAFNISNE